MSISKDLFLAILSLDSYNRGYGAGIAGLSEDSNGSSKVGSATIVKNIADAELDTEAQTAGFYAISYTVGAGVDDIDAGTTVISYRGTDNFGAFSDISGANDVLNGWLGGAGSPTSQTSLALQFYSGVTGRSVFEGAAANTIVTGHSLGGGLAGLVSALQE